MSKSLNHHPQQPAKTLMRHSVKTPLTHTAKHRQLAKRGGQVIAAKLSASQVEPQRLLHARSVKKSRAISRFAKSVFVYEPGSLVTPGEEPSAVPVIVAPAPPVSPANPTSQLLERALSQANSHHQPKHHPARRHVGRKALKLSATTLGLALVAGLTIYLNAAKLTVNHAAGVAGFAAHLPGQQPPGFSIGQVSYGSGYVTINYGSNSDGRAFSLAEKPASVDSQPLTIDSQHNATVVKHGIEFQITSHGSLSDRQLADIANSL